MHLDDARWIAGGGGGIAFHQLAKSDGEIHFFTALGNDEAAAAIAARLEATGAQIHAARRREPQTRDIVLVTPNGERTIIVMGQPLHPTRDDALPWDILRHFDAVYFTAQDPRILQGARAARVLVVTARRAEALRKSGVHVDVVVGSKNDPREAGTLANYRVPPKALVMTDGANGGSVLTADGVSQFESVKRTAATAGVYGAGDSFAGALTWFLACGLPVDQACAEASVYGAAVLDDIDPLIGQRPIHAVAASK